MDVFKKKWQVHTQTYIIAHQTHEPSNNTWYQACGSGRAREGKNVAGGVDGWPEAFHVGQCKLVVPRFTSVHDPLLPSIWDGGCRLGWLHPQRSGGLPQLRWSLRRCRLAIPRRFQLRCRPRSASGWGQAPAHVACWNLDCVRVWVIGMYAGGGCWKVWRHGQYRRRRP